MSGAREQLIELYGAAVAGANVESLTASAVASVPLERRHRVWLFAFGKAAHQMAGAAFTTLKRGLAEVVGGVVVGPEAGDAPSGAIASLVGDHPVPGPRSLEAAARIQQVLSQKRGGDLSVVLLSGGTSSLIGAPLRGLSETDYAQLCELLLGSGLDITRMNVVRKRFSQWGAGRLALALAPTRSYCFAVSDVPGDDLPSIGSGPCVPDASTAQQVVDLLEGSRINDKIAPGFRRFLVDTVQGTTPETPKPTHPAFAHVTARVIANNSVALSASAATARRAGHSVTVSDTVLTGDASAAGARLAEALVESAESAPAGASLCLLWGGETTVALNGSAPNGGRCQELALAAAQKLAEYGDRARGITLLAAGTDGRDGTTDAAGAIVDARTWARISAAGLDAAGALKSHDAYRALGAADALFSPGLTGTNVMDVAIGLVLK